MKITLYGIDFIVEESGESDELIVYINKTDVTDFLICCHYGNKNESVFDQLYFEYCAQVKK
jgi:hypothetical protein